MFLTVSPNINNTLCDIIYILVFVDNVIHPITDERFCYFISWIKIGWDLFLMSIELSLLLLSLLSTLLPRLTWTVFHVLSMLLLAMLLSLSISSFDVSISLRTWFSFFKSSLWFSDDLVFSLRYIVLSFSILCNISSIEINGLRMSLTL